MSAPSSTRHERRALWVLMAAVALALYWFVVRPLLAPLVLATLTVVIFQPVHRRIERRLAGFRIVSALVSMGFLTVIIALPVTVFTILFVVQAQQVLAEMIGDQEAESFLVDALRRFLEWADRVAMSVHLDVRGVVEAALRDLGSKLYAGLPDALALAGRLGLGILVAGLALFFLLLRGPEIVERVIEVSPLQKGYTRRLLERLEATIRGVFLGGVVTALFQGTVGVLGFWLTGFQNYVVWGALVAAASFVPFVGTGLVTGPALLYLVVTGHYGRALVLLVFAVIIAGVDNLLRALTIRTQVAVHPLVIFLAILGSIATLGLMGVLYGPLLAAVATEMYRIYLDDFRRGDQPSSV